MFWFFMLKINQKIKCLVSFAGKSTDIYTNIYIFQNWTFYFCAKFQIFNRLRSTISFKKYTLAQVFSCKFCKIFGNTFFYRIAMGYCFWRCVCEVFKIWFLVDCKFYNSFFVFYPCITTACIRLLQQVVDYLRNCLKGS